MRKITTRGISTLLILALCLFLCANTYEIVAASNTTNMQKLENALSEKKELENALSNAKNKVSALQKSQKNAEAKVNELTNEISSVSAKIYEIELQLKDIKDDIDASNVLLDEAKKKKEEQFSAMKLRIQFMYENERNSMINVLLGSSDMSSMINAVSYLTELSAYDRAQLNELEELEKYQQEILDNLTKDYQEIIAIEKSLEEQKSAVNVLLSAKNQELTKLKSDVADAKTLQKEYEQEVEAQNEILAIIAKQIAEENGKNYQNFMSAAGFLWPCPSYTRVSSDFGKRSSPTAGATTNHQGVDLAAPSGSDILAAQSGTVTKAAYGKSMGNYLIVNHGKDSSGNTICTIYEHCSKLLVSEGQVVYQGQVIAKVGSTGVSTGPHLHFGVTKGGSYVSPWNYVTKP